MCAKIGLNSCAHQQQHNRFGSVLIDSYSSKTIVLVCFITVNISLIQTITTIDTTITDNSTNSHYFKVKPTDVEVIEGDDAELQCQISSDYATSALQAKVQWAKDGFLLGFDRLIPGYNRYLMIVDEDRLIYNLRIHNTQIDDESEFECQSQIAQPYGSKQAIRSAANLRLIVPPKTLTINGSKSHDVPNQNQNQGHTSGSYTNNIFIAEAKEGEKIVLICSASPSKPPPKLKWFRKNTELLSEAAKTFVNKSVVNNRHILYTIDSYLTLYPKSEEEYKCVAEHPGLSKPLRATVFINIFKSPNTPVIDGYKEGDILNFQEKLTLKCSSSNGYPPPSVIWLRNGIEVDRSYIVGNRNEVINTLTLVVTAAENLAQYTCQASNLLTPIPLTQSVTLSVLFLPTKISIDGPNEVLLLEPKGTVINLKCTAYPASPLPFETKLKWFLNSIEITSGDEHMEVIRKNRTTLVVVSNLTYTLTQREPNIKTFKCTGYTSALKEESVSAIHKITAIYAPDFPTLLGIKDSLVSVVAGNIVKCKCVSFSGNPRPDMIWLNADNREISAISSLTGSGVSSELVIRPEPKDNGQTLKCRVVHRALEVPYEISFRLIVYYPPKHVFIVFPPFIKANDTVKIECQTSASNPGAVITLLKNGRNLADQSSQSESLDINVSDVQTKQNKSLAKITKAFATIVASVEDNESVITCLATNPVVSEGVVRADEVLTVYFKPQFESVESHLELNEFENKVVNLSVKANPTVDRYQWKRVKKSFMSNTVGHIGHSNDDLSLYLSSNRSEQWEDIVATKGSIRVKGSAIYISNVSRTDSGLYVCNASNKIGDSTALLRLNVFYPAAIVSLKIVTQHDRAVPREGDSYFQLECKVDSNPVAKVKWKKEDISKTNDNIDWFRAKVKEERSQTLMQRYFYQISILIIYNISRTDSGLYTCYTLGDSQQIPVNVKFRPNIIRKNLKIAADVDENPDIRFVCLANGYPYVQFNWTANTGDIVSNNHKYVIISDKIDDNSNQFKSELIVNKLNQNDFKSYKCLAFNELGTDEVIFELIKKNFPESPTNLRTINVSRNSVLIAWNPGFDSGYEQSFRVRYWKVVSKKSKSEPSNNPQYNYVIVNNTSNEVLITNLESDTEYQLSISSRNRLGESLMSSEFLTVKTLAKTISKRKLETVLASADEQKLGYNNQIITEQMIELSVIVSVSVLFLFTMSSVVICCYKKRRTAQVVLQKNCNTQNSKDISLANSTTEERPFTISASTTLESGCNFNTSLLEQHQNIDKCLYVEKRDSFDDFDLNKVSQNFIYKTQPDIIIINQSYPQSEEQCLEIHQTYNDNEFNLNELNIDSNLECNDYNQQQIQQKIKRVSLIKPVLSPYQLTTLNEEEEIL